MELVVYEKENSEFKPVKLCLKIDLVSYPARAEGLVNIYFLPHDQLTNNTYNPVTIFVLHCVIIYFRALIWFQIFLSNIKNLCWMPTRCYLLWPMVKIALTPTLCSLVYLSFILGCNLLRRDVHIWRLFLLGKNKHLATFVCALILLFFSLRHLRFLNRLLHGWENMHTLFTRNQLIKRNSFFKF